MRRNYEQRIGELERKKISVHIPRQHTDGEQVQFEQRVTIEESRNEIKALTVNFLIVALLTLVDRFTLTCFAPTLCNKKFGWFCTTTRTKIPS
mgnify:CR=1 FL=1